MQKIILALLALLTLFYSFSQENLKNDILLFPNTASTQVNLLLSEDVKPTNITVYDLNGRLVQSVPVNDSSFYNIDIQTFSEGMYVVAITTESETRIKKFVVDPNKVNLYSHYNGSNGKVINKVSLTANIGSDEIVSVDTPTRFDRGSTTNVSVEYSTSEARDIYVAFKGSSSPYTLYQSAVVNIGAGSGTVQVPIAVPSDVPVADNSYRYQILLLPTGQQGYNNRLDARYVSSLSVTDGAPPTPLTGTDEIVSIDGPKDVARGSTVNVSVDYSAGTARDISVALKLNTSPWTSYIYTVSVGAGSGTVQVPITVPSDALVGVESYTYQVLLLPTGQQGYNNRVGEGYVGKVSVIDSTPLTGNDEIVSVNVRKSIARGSTFNVSVEYSNSIARDVSVALKLTSSPETTYQSAVVNADAGSGTVLVPITVPSDALIAADSYAYQILLLPTGQQDNSNLLDEVNVTGVGVTDSGLSGKLPACADGSGNTILCDLDFKFINTTGGVQSIFDRQDAALFIEWALNKAWALRQYPILKDEINKQLGTDYRTYNEAQNAFTYNYVKNIKQVENLARTVETSFGSEAWQLDKKQESYTKELAVLNQWKKDGLHCVIQDVLIVGGFPQQTSPECQVLFNTEVRGRTLKSLGAGNFNGPSAEFISLNNEVLKDFAAIEYEAGVNRAYERGVKDLVNDEGFVNTFAHWHNLHINDRDHFQKVLLMAEYLHYTAVGRFNQQPLSTVSNNPFENFESYERLVSMGKQNAPSLGDEVRIFHPDFEKNEILRCQAYYPNPVGCLANIETLLDLKEEIIQEHVDAFEEEEDDEPVCVEVCDANEKLDEDKCECIPTNCEYKTGYLHESAFTDKTAALGENTTSSQDNFRDESGVIVADINCDSGKIDSESTVNVLGPKESRDYVKTDGTTAQANYFQVEYLDCPKGNKPGNPDYDSAKPCSDCTSGDPVPNPEIQAQLTACGVKGGMYGYTRGVASGCTSQKHGGIDIANAEGDAVYAMFDGTAVLAEQSNGTAGAGFYVTITSTVDGDTIKSYYFHLEDDTRVSGSVKAGDIIGYQGTSGNLQNGIDEGTTESHVHIKIKKNGTTVDPIDYFKTEFNETTGAVTSSGCN